MRLVVKELGRRCYEVHRVRAHMILDKFPANSL